jgi:hypothetical protein
MIAADTETGIRTNRTLRPEPQRVRNPADYRPPDPSGNLPPDDGRESVWPGARAVDPGCSLTRGLDVKLSMLYLPGSLFSPQ